MSVKALDAYDSTLRLVSAIDAELKEIMSQYWITPEEMQRQIQNLLIHQEWSNNYAVQVSGETDNISLYLIDPSTVIVVMPFADVRHNIVLSDTGVLENLVVSNDNHYGIVPRNTAIDARLQWPKLLLVNLSVVDNFPVPRLSLSVGVLASYVRRKQRGIVRIIDMQMGSTVEQVVDMALSFEPNAIGLSISYGQKHVAFELLSALENAFSGQKKPLLIAGNIIPASSPEEFMMHFPRLLIGAGEGEYTILGLLQHLSEGLPLSQVEGLIWLDDKGTIVRNPLTLVPINDHTFPALDTLDELVQQRGALTLELSRGCQYNVCTFCPRHHKAGNWKGLSPEETLRQFSLMANIMDRTGLPRRIFLADEEFVGYLPNDGATDRILAICDGVIERKLNISFDTENRVDQIYNPDKDKAWHIRRMEMWLRLRQAGLDRLFMGVESGATNQIKRYGKGIVPEHTVIAVRILTALGISLRFGFIMFDPLMVGFQDLKENMAFLERTDAILRPVDLSKIDLETLYERLVHDDEFVQSHSTSRPLYSVVSYMLASLEVLINSPYERMVQKVERSRDIPLVLDKGRPDTNMGRRYVRFVDETVGILSDSSQRWIDRNFALAYALKSFYKTASVSERKLWMSYMITYRELSHYLLKTMIYILDQGVGDDISILLQGFHGSQFPEIQKLKLQSSAFSTQQIASICLTFFETYLSRTVDQIEAALEAGMLKDNTENRMRAVIQKWRHHHGDWSLINDPMRNVAAN